MSDKAIIRLSPNPEGFAKVADELEADMFVSDLPLQHSHQYFEDEALGLSVGVWDTDDMIEAAGPYGCDEFMWLIEGAAAIENQKTGIRQSARADEAFIIPKGYDCQWHQKGYLRKFYVIYEPPGSETAQAPTHEGIVKPRQEISGASTDPHTPFRGGEGQVIFEDVCYRDASEKFLAGTWASEALATDRLVFPFNEFFCVQSDSITLSDRSGAEQVFHAGDAFFIPEGVECSVKIHERVKMFFAIVLPK